MAEDTQIPEFEYTDLLPLLSDPYEEIEFNHLGNSGVSEICLLYTSDAADE